MASKKVRFPGGCGDELTGVLHLPETSQPFGSVILSHSFTSSKNLKIIARLGRTLSSLGFVVLRFDFTGLGESDGQFHHTTLSTNLEDLDRALHWMKKDGHGNCALIGHSMGGAAALLASTRCSQVTAVAVLATPSEVRHVLKVFRDEELEAIRRNGSAIVQIMDRPIRIGRDFIHDLERHDLQKAAAQLKRPFLVVHGTGDRLVLIGEGERLFQSAHQPKSFFSIPEADHLFSRGEHAELATQVLAFWLRTITFS